MLASPNMRRYLYSLILILLTPFLIGRVIRKYRQEDRKPLVFARLFGAARAIQSQAIWIHGCSLGESKVALRLAGELKRQDPIVKIVCTATTPAGLDVLEQSEFDSFVFPWDLPWVWGQWFEILSPKALVVIETELWPNLVNECYKRGVPIIIANGRLSEKSLRGYLRFEWLIGPMWSQVTKALMQSTQDVKNLHALGVPEQAISEVGSIKLDHEPLTVSQERLSDLIAWKRGRPLVCLMSSHAEDDEVLLSWIAGTAEMALLIVPRHPIRASSIKESARARGLSVSSMSDINISTTKVLIGDKFGDMGVYLTVSDIITIGGSFSGKGGQNPIEPAGLRKPMIAGPSMFNFQFIADGLETAGGMKRVLLKDLSQAIPEVLERGSQMGENAYDWVEQNKGSTALQASAVLEVLSKD